MKMEATTVMIEALGFGVLKEHGFQDYTRKSFCVSTV